MLRTGISKIARQRKFVKSGKIGGYTGTGLTLVGVGYLTFHPEERKYLRAAAGSAIRFSRTLAIGLVISIDYYVGPMLGYEDSDIHRRSAERIVKGCMENGGIYIKLGQGLAAINHILPKEYTNALSVLQDKCLTRGFEELEEMFLQDFEKKSTQVFQRIEPIPVAAASLAQVYKGVTHEGNNVAIKVQYNDLRDRFKTDMKVLVYILRTVAFIHPKFNLYWIIDDMFETLAQELDFELEGKNSEICAGHLKKYTFAYIPKIYWNLSTKRILTTEWIDGVKISNTEALKKQGFDIRDIDKKFITLMAEQVFHTGFVHADPHPGNVLVRNVKNGQAQIVILDHGLYQQLAEETRVTLCNFWESMVFKRPEFMNLYAQQLGVNDFVLFAEMLTQMPFSVPLVNVKMGDMSADEYMAQQAREKFDKISDTLKSMPSSVILVIRNLNTVRSIIKDHGNLVDRYRLMARMAVSGRHRVVSRSYRKRLSAMIGIIKFEARLWVNSFVQWFIRLYLKLLQNIGYDVERVIEALVIS